MIVPPLYPDPGPVSTPPTWEDVERLSLHFPEVRAAVTMFRVNALTKEQALTAAVYGLARTVSLLHQTAVEAGRSIMMNVAFEKIDFMCPVCVHGSRLRVCEPHAEEIAAHVPDEQVAAALEDLAFARDSHLSWAEHLEAHAASGESCPECDAKPYKLDPAHEREWVAKYDRIISIVKKAKKEQTA